MAAFSYLVGVDENGLGARLGPLVVTGVLAKADDLGRRALSRKLPASVRADLDDSKRLVSHSDVALGEAWARAVLPEQIETPDQLLEHLLYQGQASLSAICPDHVRPQCWGTTSEAFCAEPALLKRVQKHLTWFRERGVEVRRAMTHVQCTKRLNDARAGGRNRFVADLHAMEDLLLRLRAEATGNVLAVCGKVGGIGSYGKFFGPLSNHLHAVIEEGKALSAYHFPKLGEVRFLRDADAEEPLVMLASLIGKYVRELLMARIARFYPEPGAPAPSGYHDPISHAFVLRTALLRKSQSVPDTCFERERDEAADRPGARERGEQGAAEV
ncbi:MAG TPA: hypothetical protein VFQ61_33965 [Polyangiaceae bacterium]|nr:hypothetical protein [Polyangiaceae bacterium]